MSTRGSLRTPATVALIGAGALVLWFGEPERVWGAYLFNLVFWLGIAAAAPTLSAAITISDGRWAEEVHVQARTWLPVLLLTLVLLAVLPLGARAIYPWANEPVAGLEVWLSPWALFGRDFLALAALALLAFRFGRRSSGSKHAAVALALAYAVVLTLLAADLVMSLQPRWVSTLFGAHFFVGAGYGALATIPVVAWWSGRRVPVATTHDLGKLLFSFALLWTYMFWSQYLVTWYGNLPHELSWWMPRVEHAPWRFTGVLVLLACFAVPFAALLSRANRRSLGALAGIGGVVLAGLWTERLLLVMPSIRPDAGSPIGWSEATVSAAFVAAVLALLRPPARAGYSDSQLP